MINISIDQCAIILTLIENKQKRLMIELSESDEFKQTDILLTQRKKLNMLYDDITYKINNIELEIE